MLNSTRHVWLAHQIAARNISKSSLARASSSLISQRSLWNASSQLSYSSFSTDLLVQSSLQRLSTSGLFADEFKHEQKSVRMLSTGSHFDKARGLSGKTPLEAYKSWIAENKLREDDSQKEAIVQFNRLLIELKQASANPKFARKTSYPTGFRPEMSSLFSMFRKGGASAQAVHSSDNVNHSAEGHVKGLYVFGGVGTGKTMLMDMFYDCIDFTQKKREHFHAFMLDIHQRLHKLRKVNGQNSNPLPQIAREIAANECRVLCLDEFQVTDVADAMILKELFTALMDGGVTVVCTSNRHPDDLYLGGINRSAFLPFIDVLKERCTVYEVENGQDHRLLGTLRKGVYLSPLNSQTGKDIQEMFVSMAGKTPIHEHVPVEVMMGRTLNVPAAADKVVAKFTFKELCEQPKSAADFIALATRFPNIIVTDIPQLSPIHQKEIVRRFITLLDVLYENSVRFICTAAAPARELFVTGTAHIKTTQNTDQSTTTSSSSSQTPTHFATTGFSLDTPSLSEHDLYGGGKSKSESKQLGGRGNTPEQNARGAKREDETFASGRAVSRLIEMQSSEYITGAPAKRKRIGL